MRATTPPRHHHDCGFLKNKNCGFCKKKLRFLQKNNNCGFCKKKNCFAISRDFPQFFAAVGAQFIAGTPLKGGLWFWPSYCMPIAIVLCDTVRRDDACSPMCYQRGAQIWTVNNDDNNNNNYNVSVIIQFY